MNRPTIPTVRFLVLAVVLACGGVGAAQEQTAKDTVVYVPPYKDPVIQEMIEHNKQEAQQAAEQTDEIVEARRALEKQRKEERPKLRFDLSDVVRPQDPSVFTTRLWHFPPTPQFLTSACWSFSTTSFLESEIKRVTGKEVKLAEMWAVYWEYVEKARGFVASRGEIEFVEGSESNAVLRALGAHGVVPLQAFPGLVAPEQRFDHSVLHDQLEEYLGWCRDTGFWDEEVILTTVRALLDRVFGVPPEVVAWEGERYTPQEFLSQVCQLDLDDYVGLMSTMSQPMWQRGEFAVPDNWWHDASYVNLPLEVWFDTIRTSLERGYSLVIGGDVSEPGLNGFEDIAVVPTFDIPADYIDQSAREFRFDNQTTTDDHGVHLVGRMQLDGHDWFLVKDSNRSSRHGKHEGYYFYRDDYVRLKMLTMLVHRDVVKEVLARVDASEE